MIGFKAVVLCMILMWDSPTHTQLFRWPFVRLRTRISNSISHTAKATANEVSFHLYPDSRNKGYHEQLLIGDSEGLKLSNFNKDLPVILFIHGFLHSYVTDFSQTMKNAYLDDDFPANIIAVDWGPLATPPGPPNLNYHVVVEKVPVVGNAVAQFLRYLMEIPGHGIPGPEYVHIVGFSLGAHIAGIAGYTLLQNNIPPLSRITGLDPAGPLFQQKERSEKLDSTDANFVDIIHTNQGMKGYSGRVMPISFPTGVDLINQAAETIRMFPTFSPVYLLRTCSHAQSYKYFVRSIKDKQMMACKCKHENSGASRTFIEPDCKMKCDKPTTFGQYCPHNARGVYYMEVEKRD